MARKRFRRKRHFRKNKGSLVRKVKKIVKNEVGKTRETQKLVSYMGFTEIPHLMDSDLNQGNGLVISLTGGANPQGSQTVQNPGIYSDKNLFVLLPAGSQGNAAQQAGQGGMEINFTANSAIGGVYQLEGRQCYLKKWYCSMIISNVRQQVDSPRPCFVRMFVVETRRPLASRNIAQQLLLQNHAVASMTPTVLSAPQTVCSYLNMANIKKVHLDKLIKLTGPAAADTGASSDQLYTRRFQVSLRKKAHWSYYYPTDDPASATDALVYQGPFLYLVLCSNQDTADQRPSVALNTMMTFYDD